jgi:DNA-binding MarR family transcriptional regulator
LPWCPMNSVANNDKKALQALLWSLKPLVNLRASIPLPFATTFLMVALDEGKSINSYAQDMGVSRFAMWRNVRNISERAKAGSPGLGLVTIEPDPIHKRRKQVYLSAKGRSLANDILRPATHLS